MEKYYKVSEKELKRLIEYSSYLIASYQSKGSIDDYEVIDTTLEQQNELLKQALKFYAEGNHYTDGIDISGRPMDVILDRGSIAQSVLNKLDSWRKQ